MPQETTSERKIQGKSINIISFKTAQKCAMRWTKQEGNYNKHHHVNTFLIPELYLSEVLKKDTDAVKAYIRFEGHGVEKLMIVGTQYRTLENSVESQDNTYDFTAPCSPACDPESPLNS